MAGRKKKSPTKRKTPNQSPEIPAVVVPERRSTRSNPTPEIVPVPTARTSSPRKSSTSTGSSTSTPVPSSLGPEVPKHPSQVPVRALSEDSDEDDQQAYRTSGAYRVPNPDPDPVRIPYQNIRPTISYKEVDSAVRDFSPKLNVEDWVRHFREETYLLSASDRMRLFRKKVVAECFAWHAARSKEGKISGLDQWLDALTAHFQMKPTHHRDAIMARKQADGEDARTFVRAVHALCNTYNPQLGFDEIKSYITDNVHPNYKDRFIDLGCHATTLDMIETSLRTAMRHHHSRQHSDHRRPFALSRPAAFGSFAELPTVGANYFGMDNAMRSLYPNYSAHQDPNFTNMQNFANFYRPPNPVNPSLSSNSSSYDSLLSDSTQTTDDSAIAGFYDHINAHAQAHAQSLRQAMVANANANLVKPEPAPTPMGPPPMTPIAQTPAAPYTPIQTYAAATAQANPNPIAPATPQKETRSCYECGKVGHLAAACWERAGRLRLQQTQQLLQLQQMNPANSAARPNHDKPRVICSYCKKPGHHISVCRTKAANANVKQEPTESRPDSGNLN